MNNAAYQSATGGQGENQKIRRGGLGCLRDELENMLGDLEPQQPVNPTSGDGMMDLLSARLDGAGWQTRVDGAIEVIDAMVKRPEALDMLKLGYSHPPRALTYMHTLTPAERQLAGVLFDYADMGTEHTAWPTQELLALRCGTTRLRVMKRLQRLEQAGFFVKVHHRPFDTTEYVLNDRMSDETFRAVAETRAKLTALQNGRPARQSKERSVHVRLPDKSIFRWGVNLLPAVLEFHDKLTAGQREILAVLWGFRRYGLYRGYLGGLPYLATMLGRSERVIRRQLAWLKKWGLIHAHRRGKRKTFSYLPQERLTPEIWLHCRAGWKKCQKYREKSNEVLGGYTSEVLGGYTSEVLGGYTNNDKVPTGTYEQERRAAKRPVQNALSTGAEAGKQRRQRNSVPFPPSGRADAEAGKQRRQRKNAGVADYGLPDEAETRYRANRLVRALMANEKQRGTGPGSARVSEATTASRPVIRAAVQRAADKPAMVKALHLAGVKAKLAAQWVEHYGLDRLKEIGRMMPDASRKGDKRDNPAGFMRRALEEGWRPGVKHAWTGGG